MQDTRIIGRLSAAAAAMAVVWSASGVQAEPIAAPTPVSGAPILPAALSEATLDGMSGGDGGVAVAVSNQRLQAVNTGNSVVADSVVTGSVSLDHGALSGFNGLGNVVINTGNNNNLQSSLNVSIVTPPR